MTDKHAGMKQIGTRIRHLRLEAGLTQKQMAEILKVQLVSEQRFEYGTVRPSLDTLLILADYFHCSLDYLVGRVDER